MSVAWDAVGAGAAWSATLGASWSHTPVGTPTAAGIGASWYAGGTAISSAKYGAASLAAKATSAANAVPEQAAIWAVANPPSGAQTVSVTFAGATYGVANSFTATGSDTTTFSSGSATGTGNDTAPTATLTSATGELAVGMLNWDDAGSGSDTVTAGLTASGWTSGVGGSGVRGRIQYGAGAASVSVAWTISTTRNWCVASVSIKEAAGGSVVGSYYYRQVAGLAGSA